MKPALPASLSRRRLIGISAAAAGLPLLPFGRETGGPAALAAPVVAWRGEALGAVALLQIHHPDRAAAAHLIERALAELRRLEGIFSLHRPDSVLAALNRAGALAAPPRELVLLLEACRHYRDLTGGAFDPTVQPLWTLYARHFAAAGPDAEGPDPGAVQAALARVGFSHVGFDDRRVAFRRADVALTLNGIAQGFVTDRVVDILRGGGVDRSLVDMGESRMLGPRPDGAPWRIGIADPQEPSRTGEVIEIVDRAVATSGGYGLPFDRAGRFHHLFDPRTGASPSRYASVTVVAATATEADALSTGFSFLAPSQITEALRRLTQVRVHLTTGSGERLVLNA